MGATATRVDRCTRWLFSESSREREDRQAQFELTVLGIPGRIKQNYDVKGVIATGKHGTVYKLIEQATGRNLAIKAFFKTQRSFQFMDVEEHALKITELKRGRLRHEYICTHMGFYESRDLFCVIMESCDGGSVKSYLDSKLQLNELKSSKIFAQCLSGISFLHSKNIIHRDIRLEQFLFTNKRRTKIKLSDLMHCVEPRSGFKVTDPAKPCIYLFAAPEVLAKSEYSAMSDMWSAGCCLFELLYGYPPFTGEDKALVQRIIGEPVHFYPLWYQVSPPALALLKAMLVKEPHDRLTAGKASLHEWFEKAAKIAVNQKMAKVQRGRKLQEAIQELKTVQTSRTQATDDGDQVAQRFESQFSRDLTATLSHTTYSTLEGQETDSDIDPDDVDSESMDWKIEQDRSDLSSHGYSGRRTTEGSETYASTAAMAQPRDNGAWDEFDSEFFESDMKNTSTWSEAEFTDWTVKTDEKNRADMEWRQYIGEDGASDSSVWSFFGEGEGLEGAESEASSQFEPDEIVEATDDSWGAKSEKKSNDDWKSFEDGSKAPPQKRKRKGRRGKKARKQQPQGLVDALKEAWDASSEDDSEAPALMSKRSSSGGWSSSAGDASPADKAEINAGSSAASESDGSEFSVAASELSSSSQASGNQAQTTAKKSSSVRKEPKATPKGGRASNLASITEDEEARAAEGIVAVTQRSMVEQGVAWQGSAKGLPKGRDDGQTSMLVMSRRSNQGRASAQTAGPRGTLRKTAAEDGESKVAPPKEKET